MGDRIYGYVFFNLAQQYVDIRTFCPQLILGIKPVSSNELPMNLPSEQMPSENSPLNGVRVLVTRPGIKPDSLRMELVEKGAIVVSHPLIEFSEPPDLDHVQDVGSRVADYCMLVFLSRRAAHCADEYFLKNAVAVPPIAAIGPGTWKCLKARGYKVSLIPAESNSESMAESLVEHIRDQNYEKPILILRADRGSNVLPIALEEAGIPFKELAVYQSNDVTQANPHVLNDLSKGKFDWMTVTSSSIAFNAAKLLGANLAHTKLVSISPTTTRAAEEAGLTIAAEATDYNACGIVKAILDHHLRNQ